MIRYLAERLGLEISQKRASDLLSMWVGGTEKNIAGAFAEARSQEAFLVFDEADSFARRPAYGSEGLGDQSGQSVTVNGRSQGIAFAHGAD
ncbi:MAG: AAA family ATPase [Nitrospira sp.]|nr:AAA family ATPase [Nitrospira sp.]